MAVKLKSPTQIEAMKEAGSAVLTPEQRDFLRRMD